MSKKGNGCLPFQSSLDQFGIGYGDLIGWIVPSKEELHRMGKVVL